MDARAAAVGFIDDTPLELPPQPVHTSARARATTAATARFALHLTTGKAYDVIDTRPLLCHEPAGSSVDPVWSAAKGPEQEDAGPRVQMTAEQLRFIGLWVGERAPAGVSIEERGQGHLEVVIWDKTGIEVARRSVFPSANDL
jgi:hypothetical protein